MNRLVLIALAALALSAAPADAFPLARWNTESHVATGWAAIGVRISRGVCPVPDLAEDSSCSQSNQRPVRMWLNPADAINEPLRWIYYHELGHAFDALVLTDSDRTRLTTLMGLRGPWQRGVPNAIPERFAEAFKLCAALGPHVTQARVGSVTDFGYRWMPTARRQRRVCRAILALAG